MGIVDVHWGYGFDPWPNMAFTEVLALGNTITGLNCQG